MSYLIPTLIENLWKSSPAKRPGRNYLVLVGINQSVFLNQWGIPEIKISLDKFRDFYEVNQLFPNPSEDGSQQTVWIYERKNEVLFFKKGVLVFHGNWSLFKKRWKKPIRSTISFIPGRTQPFFATTLGLMA